MFEPKRFFAGQSKTLIILLKAPKFHSRQAMSKRLRMKGAGLASGFASPPDF